jgi:hypothetical protein
METGETKKEENLIRKPEEPLPKTKPESESSHFFTPPKWEKEAKCDGHFGVIRSPYTAIL